MWKTNYNITFTDILDSALLRPGRIDRKIEFPPPGPEARVAILRIHSRKVNMHCSRILSAIADQRFSITSQMSQQRGINMRDLAEKMGQCSGAEVRGICTEAGMSYFVPALVFRIEPRI